MAEEIDGAPVDRADRGGAAARLSVVIPAHNEERVIGRLLEALAESAATGELEVIVVCNGCTDSTPRVARATIPDAAVIELDVASKSAALNAGDQRATCFPRFYVDADVELTMPDLRTVATALEEGEILCAAPQPRFVLEGRPWAIRAFYRVWQEMPYLNDEVVGSGVYALSELGRRRFGAFPDLTADDQFVMQMFDTSERRALPSARFVVHPPTRLAGLLQMRTRVYRGNAELARQDATSVAPTGGRRRALLRLCRRPAWLPALAVYIGLNLAATWRAGRSRPDVAWERDESGRRQQTPAPERQRPGESLSELPRVAYVVSRYPTVSHTFVLREVMALRAAGVDVATFSVVRTEAADHLSEAERAEAARTQWIRPVGLPAVLRVHARLIARHPRAWSRTLATALRQSPPGARARLWQVFYFVEAVLLWDKCRRRDIRHVHAHFANVGADLAWLAADLGVNVDGPGTWRWSMTMHGATEFAHIERFNLRRKTEAASLVICISDFTRSQLMALVGADVWDRLVVVHMGVDLNRFACNRAAPADPSQPVSILNVGRLDPVKGQALVIEAVAALCKAGCSCRLTIVGAGPAEDDLRAVISRLGVEEVVELAGARGQDELPGFYAAADIFCLPSFAEGLPIVLMEAMAARLPVVTTAIAAIPELVEDGRSGYVVRPGRVDQLVGALDDLIGDPRRRAGMGSAGHDAVASSFELTECARRTAEMFAALGPLTPPPR